MKNKSQGAQKKQKNQGLTLLEFIIYFALTVVMVTLVVQISINVFMAREKLRAHQEVTRSGRSAMDAIVEAVLQAEEVAGVSSDE